MNNKGAEVAAFARWGNKGAVQSVTRKDGSVCRTVGRVVMGMFLEVQGQGETWKEAFADADKKKEHSHAL